MADSQNQTTTVAQEPHASASTARPAFRLLHYFSLASLAAIVVAAVVLAVLYQRLAVRDLIEAQETHHVALSRVSANVLWPQFSAFIASSVDLDDAALRSHPEVEQLSRAVTRDLAGTRVLRLKIYDLAGRTVFSTEADQLGKSRSSSPGFVSARDGKPASGLEHHRRFNAFDKVIENVDVLSTHIPIRKPGSGDVEAVFEISSDFSNLLQRTGETRNEVFFRVSAVLLALYLALFYIVRHADGIIQRQEARRREDEAALRSARNELAQSEQFHRALTERASDAVVVIDTGFTVYHATPTVEEVLGRQAAHIVGAALTGSAREEYREPLKSWLAKVSAEPGVARPFEFEGEHATKGRRFYVANATNLLADPAVHGIVVNIRDITDRKRAEMQARRLALYDGLTGLARRDFFAEQTRRAIAHAKRYEENLAILFLDLDGFKRINDMRGHDAGDALLRAVAERMRETLREGDTIGRYLMPTEDHVARFGGDEFMILLTRLQQPADAASAARRLLGALARPYTMANGIQETITTSIGIAIFPQDGRDMEELMKRADAAMYAAKVVGKNTYKLAAGA